MIEFCQADAARLPFGDGSFNLVFGSPSYMKARTYGIGAQRNCRQWIDWMLAVTTEAVRVSKGLVIWIVAGETKDWCYQPGPEGLLYEWWKRGGRCWRPAFWHRIGIPGSGGKQWLRADVEYALCFTGCKKGVPWADNTANGHPPRRDKDGKRESRPPGPNRRANGKQKKVARTAKRIEHAEDGTVKGDHDRLLGLAIANPGVLSEVEETAEEVLVRWISEVGPESPSCIQGIKVGGGLMGHKLAHDNEAPFPQKLAEWFIRGWCPPNGSVLDPFAGSGTTVAAAIRLGRSAVGSDLRLSQCVLGRKRCRDVQPEMLFGEQG